MAEKSFREGMRVGLFKQTAVAETSLWPVKCVSFEPRSDHARKVCRVVWGARGVVLEEDFQDKNKTFLPETASNHDPLL